MNRILTENKEFTYQDYLKTDDDNRYEVIKGSLYMVPAPNTEHQHFSRNLEFLIWNYVREKSLGEVYHAPIDVILDEKNIVQPDILFISNENSGIIKKKGIFGSPDLAIEIISPSSKTRDNYEKKALYQLFKVKEYWIVDPANKSIEILKLNKDNVYELHSNGYLDDEDSKKNVVSSIFADLEIDLEKIFNRTF
jgi:Uma2 family endonuclease